VAQSPDTAAPKATTNARATVVSKSGRAWCYWAAEEFKKRIARDWKAPLEETFNRVLHTNAHLVDSIAECERHSDASTDAVMVFDSGAVIDWSFDPTGWGFVDVTRGPKLSKPQQGMIGAFFSARYPQLLLNIPKYDGPPIDVP
jgi:hypothetical protein